MISKIFSIKALLFLVFAVYPVNAGAGELLYFYSDACSYCEQWDEEVGSLYNKTVESKVFKLRPVDIHEQTPSDIDHVKGVIYTPTFVAMENGREVGRILGYGNEIFFWQHMEVLIRDMEKSKVTKISPCLEGLMKNSSLTC